MEHPFMAGMQRRFAERSIATVLFNFPYKERGGRAPDRPVVLEGCYRAVVEQIRADRHLLPSHLFIGGKSMGGRIATHIAASDCAVDGILLLGYPLHPPGKTDRLRKAHLPDIGAPLLFFQGTRDSLCNLGDLRDAIGEMQAPVELHVIDGGDHSFKVLKSLGRTDDEVLDEIADRGRDWIKSRLCAINPKNTVL